MPKIPVKQLLWGLFFVVLIFGGLLGYVWWNNSNYQEYQVKRGTLKTFIASSGQIKAEKEANLMYNSAGWITDLPVKENDTVKENQVVAKIDPTEASKNLTEAEAAYRSAKAALDKTIDDIHLFQYGNGGFDKVGTSNETQTQKTQRQQAEEAVNTSYDDLQKAKYALTRTVIKAPFDGVVTKVTAQLNEATTAFSNQPIIQIVDFSTLYFEAEIDQEKSGLVKVGQTASITLDALKSQPLAGTVYEVANAVKITPEGDTIIPVKIKFDSPANLKMGWKGDIEIDLETKQNVLLIPKQAVEYQDGKSVVRVKDGWLTKTKPVKLGDFDGVNWQILEGLSDNETILLKKSA